MRPHPAPPISGHEARRARCRLRLAPVARPRPSRPSCAPYRPPSAPPPPLVRRTPCAVAWCGSTAGRDLGLFCVCARLREVGGRRPTRCSISGPALCTSDGFALRRSYSCCVLTGAGALRRGVLSFGRLGAWTGPQRPGAPAARRDRGGPHAPRREDPAAAAPTGHRPQRRPDRGGHPEGTGAPRSPQRPGPLAARRAAAGRRPAPLLVNGKTCIRMPPHGDPNGNGNAVADVAGT